MYVPGFFKIDISHDDIDRFFIVLMIYKHVPCFFFKVSPPFFSSDRWYRLAKSFAFWKFGTQNQRHIGGVGYTQFIQQRHIIVWWCCSWNYLNPIIYLTPQRWNTFSSLQKRPSPLYPLFSDFHGFLNRFLRIFFSSSWEHQSSLKYYVYIKYSDFFLIKKISSASWWWLV